MKKTLYSLMLDEDVVREVDNLAHRLGATRSGLINEILAEYVNYTTPQKRINDVLSAIERLMSPSLDLIPAFTPNTSSMSLKSSLEYKYRPTIRYEVELSGSDAETAGTLSVVFRTTSAQLISAMSDFFVLWKRIEDAHLAPLCGYRTRYQLSDGRFSRTIALPSHGCTAEELAAALSEYIKLFDRMLKSYLSGRCSAHEVEAAYYSYLLKAPLHF